MQLSWKLSELESIPRNGLKVFSTFCCGGGSSMGYKLAGYELVGACEIDVKMQRLYEKNLRPPAFFKMPIQELNKLKPAIGEIDILDGSPPCSTFSMAGSREDAWGKKKKFREGQAEQVLDDLFFHFIETANWMRPRMVVAENVKGLIQGNAKGFVKMIFEEFRKAGYDTQLFLLNSSRMGVPQRRERVFFIARRSDLGLEKANLFFNGAEIPLRVALEGVKAGKPVCNTKMAIPLWKKTKPGKSLSAAHENGFYFNWIKTHPDQPAATIAARCLLMHWKEPRCLTGPEITRIQTFPDDYDFLDEDPGYVCGMSVPPFMMESIAKSIAYSLK